MFYIKPDWLILYGLPSIELPPGFRIYGFDSETLLNRVTKSLKLNYVNLSLNLFYFLFEIINVFII
jgi:hypothetical protein